MKKIIVCICAIFTPIVYADFHLTQKQVRLMEYAYQLGEKHNLSKAMVGVLYQETKAGAFTNEDSNLANPNSLGIMQIKPETANFIQENLCPGLKRPYVQKSDLRKALVLDKKWNMKLALCYLNWLREERSWRMMLVAYNRGPKAAEDYDETFRYARNIANMVENGVVDYFIEEHIKKKSSHGG